MIRGTQAAPGPPGPRAATYLQPSTCSGPTSAAGSGPGPSCSSGCPAGPSPPLVLAAQARVALGDEIGAARALGGSGVALKDEGPVLPPGAG